MGERSQRKALRDRKARITGVFAILAVVLAGVVSCASPGQDHRPIAVPSTPSAPPSLPSAALPDPLEPYLPTSADKSAIEASLRDAVAACVRRYGLPSPASMRIKRAPAPEFETSLANIAGLLPLASARRFGYTAAVAGESDTPLLALDIGWSVSYHLAAADNAMRTALTDVLTGRVAQVHGLRTPSGGCLNAAVEAMLGADTSQPGQLANDIYAVPLFLTEQALAQMLDDPRVKNVTARWRECMRRTGYVYPSPAEAEADPRWLAAASNGASMTSLASMERPVATADASCRNSVNYTDVRLSVFDESVNRLLGNGGTKLRLQQFHSEVLHLSEHVGANIHG